jgi:hypothetical protein
VNTAKFTVCVPTICPVVTAVFLFTWGAPVSELYRGWVNTPADGAIGPLAL